DVPAALGRGDGRVTAEVLDAGGAEPQPRRLDLGDRRTKPRRDPGRRSARRALVGRGHGATPGRGWRKTRSAASKRSAAGSSTAPSFLATAIDATFSGWT